MYYNCVQDLYLFSHNLEVSKSISNSNTVYVYEKRGSNNNSSSMELDYSLNDSSIKNICSHSIALSNY